MPLPSFVVGELAAHIATYGAGPGGLLFRKTRGGGWRRGSFNYSVWKPTLRRAGLDTGYGTHAGRHTYASTLIGQRSTPRSAGSARPEWKLMQSLHPPVTLLRPDEPAAVRSQFS